MLNKLAQLIRSEKMLQPGDTVTCAVSGGADSMALLWGMYLLKEKFEITVQAAHFNHHLRGAESDRDEAFVRDFCAFHDIPFFCGGGEITAGEKGLEAAAREARYAFFDTIPGKIATAHTADDNAETVIMHLVRGTGMRGLGGISPVRGRIIRPMLNITREEVLSFLAEHYISHIEDSSNAADAFLRNRIRHSVMPLLKAENPRLSANLSAMAQRLRADADYLDSASNVDADVNVLRELPDALRSRALERILKENGVKEPEAEHIVLTEKLLFSQKPSASARFPGGVTMGRVYDRFQRIPEGDSIPETELLPGMTVAIPGQNLCVSCMETDSPVWTYDRMTVRVNGKLWLRSRRPGDTIRLNGGSKSLQKLMIDRKIPAHLRDSVPVIADDDGVVAVYGIGGSIDKKCEILPAVTIIFAPQENIEM